MSAVAAWAADGENDEGAALWPLLDLDSYDRRDELTGPERAALIELGPAHLRRSRARGAGEHTPLWEALSRLARPLDDVRAALHHTADARYRRAGAHAAGLVLAHCAESGRAYWGWTGEDWAQLCRACSEAFLAARTLPTETTVRPFLVALAYLLGGFTDFQRLGTFNRLHLAQLVFGPAVVEPSMLCAGEVLDQWGYRSVLSAKHRWRGVFSQALLINRSPRLEDLSTEAFVRLRAHPACTEHHAAMLYALQRVMAALGHCEPPVRTGCAAVIEGADPDWTASVERWYATSTLSAKPRATVRTQIAKARPVAAR